MKPFATVGEDVDCPIATVYVGAQGMIEIVADSNVYITASEAREYAAALIKAAEEVEKRK